MALAAAACQTTAKVEPEPETAPASAQVDYVPSSEPLVEGLKQFDNANYGLAERYLRDAVEKFPKDPAGWIALAACYDHMRRFDLADRAYDSAIRLSGQTAQILNNRGYSYLLRNDFQQAYASFIRASKLDPGNATIANNIAILREKVGR